MTKGEATSSPSFIKHALHCEFLYQVWIVVTHVMALGAFDIDEVEPLGSHDLGDVAGIIAGSLGADM